MVQPFFGLRDIGVCACLCVCVKMSLEADLFGYLLDKEKVIFRKNAHNDQKFQREQKKSSPIFKCKTIISALFSHYIDVF